ncbi:GNAT family N-acetyltransferase [Mesorhizobium sp. VK4C]|uniref:GNAT family N-acetyltransferase n=1 Tax=Mesorhizobium captivum TaxID=3072319 RepID=UPI002A24774C|nr:GNAT family N-acetyltransferase [Mesorhizobium sp. VK4C]MDX8502452.1 GNAT family N-acetyltransferase [Mesorhizobium sp. VK4C]
MNVELQSVAVSDREIVRKVWLPEDQEQYAGSIDAVFDDLAKSSHPAKQHAFAVVSCGVTVGFFILRERESVPDWSPPDVITLHSFRISLACQGKGLGRAAVGLAISWIGKNRPLVRRMMLAVNARNVQARTAYLRYGFVDTGTRVSGPVGDQHLLSIDVSGRDA